MFRSRSNRLPTANGSRSVIPAVSPPAVRPPSSPSRAAFRPSFVDGALCRERIGARATPKRACSRPTAVQDGVSRHRSAVSCLAPVQGARRLTRSRLPCTMDTEQDHEEWNSGRESDVPIDSNTCSRRGGDGRPHGGAGPGPGDRQGARHRDGAGIRLHSRCGRPRCGHGRLRADRRTGKVRHRRRAGRLLRGPRATRAPDRGTTDGDRRSGPVGDGGTSHSNSRPFART